MGAPRMLQMMILFRISVAVNVHHQRWEPAAEGIRIVTELAGGCRGLTVGERGDEPSRGSPRRNPVPFRRLFLCTER